jgi:2-polyprenyl-3-methyl-5-hydroxy-6-metoxy-1,4-benzoquinol methylase
MTSDGTSQQPRDAAVYDAIWSASDALSLQTSSTVIAMLQALMSPDRRTANPRLVDLGAGSGRHAVAAARRGLDVLALDHNANAIEAIRSQARDLPLLRAEQCDVRAWLDQQHDVWDGVVCFDVLHHFTRTADEAAHYLAALAALVGPGGRTVVTLLCDLRYGISPGPQRLHVSAEEGAALLGQSFADFDVQRLVRKPVRNSKAIDFDEIRREIVRAPYEATRVLAMCVRPDGHAPNRERGARGL